MLQLDDPKWPTLQGGYRIPYDASKPLRQLESKLDPDNEERVLKELWNELHHQGDVGEASYAALPHLLRIACTKPRLNWNYFGLIGTIEEQRHEPQNPQVPKFLADAYFAALRDLPRLVTSHPDNEWDELLSRCIVSCILLVKGHRKIAKAVSEMNSASAEEFMMRIIYGVSPDQT